MLIDSHAHIDMILEESPVSEADLIRSMMGKGVGHAVQVSIDMASLLWSREFIRRDDGGSFYFTAGIHPSSLAGDDMLSQLDAAVGEIMNSGEKERLFGIGECGLDYYRMRQPKIDQVRSFERQIVIAKKYGLPLIVHTREAIEDTIGILKRHTPLYGIIHCFPGNKDDAARFLDLDFYCSFAGNVTYSKSSGIQEAARYMPLDRMLIETDAPFLTPVPLRGRKNVPENVEYIYGFISELRNQRRSIIEEYLERNFTSLLERRGNMLTGR
jgi:TatD DNase family protein